MLGQRANVETEISKWTAACVVGSHFVADAAAVVLVLEFFVMQMIFLISQRAAPHGRCHRVQRSAG